MQEHRSKQQRLEVANQAIRIIANHGRRFFSLEAEGRKVEVNRISQFELRGARLWFRDKYSNKLVYVAYKYNWRHFSEGGTLRSLVRAMADWIIGTREEFPLGHFGPWPMYVCGGDLWGYGESMAEVREQIKKLLDTFQCRSVRR